MLIAEDEADVRDVLTRLVIEMGFKVLQAVDGQQAIELMRAHPHLVRIAILDYTLPCMNGEETARVLNRFRPELPIIIANGVNTASCQIRNWGATWSGSCKNLSIPTNSGN